MRRLMLIGLIAVLATSLAAKKEEHKPGGSFENIAPDFPIGMFNDGQRYSLEDFKGKVVVLLFFESACPSMRASMPNFSKIAQKYKDKPVKFIAIQPHDSFPECKAYVGSTKLAMPVFADTFGVMQTRYQEHMSLHNIEQIRLIDVDGIIQDYVMESEKIDEQLARVKWKYKDQGYDKKLDHVIDLLEWNQYPAAMTELKPKRKDPKKDVAESAEKLYQAVHAEGEQWKTDADAAADSDPILAFETYTKISNVFAGDDLAKQVADPLKKLKTDKRVKDELSARQDLDRVYAGMAKATQTQKGQVVTALQQISTKYPKSPTGIKAADLAKELAATPSPVN